MTPLWIAAVLVGLILLAILAWMLLQGAQGQRKNQALETQMNELRRDLLTLSAAQAQSSAKMETIANNVASSLGAVTTALQRGVSESAAITSQR